MRWRRRLAELDDYLGVALLTVMTVVMSAQVISRYVLNASLSWSEEITRVLFTWLVFIGAPAVMKRGDHMGIETLVEALPVRAQRVARLLTDVLTAVFAGFLLYAGAQFLQTGAQQVLPATGLSRAWAYIPIPLGGLLLAIRAAARIIRRFSFQREMSTTSEPVEPAEFQPLG